MSIEIKHPKTLTDRELLEQMYDMIIVLHDRVMQIHSKVSTDSDWEDETLFLPHDNIEDIQNEIEDLHKEYKEFGLDK